MTAQSAAPAPAAAEPDSNQKLLAALCYPLFPLVSLFILLVEEQKQKAFQRYHAIQALGAGVVVWVLYIILSIIVGVVLGALTLGIGSICSCVLWVVPIGLFLYWAYQAYMGKTFEIPVITKFMQDQKWL